MAGRRENEPNLNNELRFAVSARRMDSDKSYREPRLQQGWTLFPATSTPESHPQDCLDSVVQDGPEECGTDGTRRLILFQDQGHPHELSPGVMEGSSQKLLGLMR